ncbi:MAG: hypothetical protein NVS3B2_15640 [Ramlibacter sp.]
MEFSSQRRIDMKFLPRILAALIASAAVASASDAICAVPTEAKVTQREASATALAKIPRGVIKSAELEKENGRLVWSFDVAQPAVRGVTEIQVDAITGKIVSIKKETAAEESREASADANKKKLSK